MALLEIRDLHVSFETRDGIVHAVDGVSLSVDRGRTLGVVGESGSGKSVTALTVMGLTRLPNATVTGQVLLDGVDLLALPADELRRMAAAPCSAASNPATNRICGISPFSSRHRAIAPRVPLCLRVSCRSGIRSSRLVLAYWLSRKRHATRANATSAISVIGIAKYQSSRKNDLIAFMRHARKGDGTWGFLRG